MGSQCTDCSLIKDYSSTKEPALGCRLLTSCCNPGGFPGLGMRLQAVFTSWGGNRCLRVPQRRASSQGWQGYKRSVRPSLAAASAGDSPERHVPRPTASGAQHLPPDVWEQACQQVAAFQHQHGRLPRAGAEAEGPLLPGERPLGLWCTQQQRRKAGSKGPPLTAQERAALLTIPGWGWWASMRVSKPGVRRPWEQWRQEVEAFHEQHGRLQRATAGKATPFLPGEKKLGRWVDRQRQHYKGNMQPPLSAERIAGLEVTPGWAWEEYLPWKQRRQEVEAFIQQHGRLPRTKAGTSNPLLPGEKELGLWCDTQRQRLKGQRHQPLTAGEQAALTALPGWYWDVEDDRWEQQRQKLEAFVRVHGRLPRTYPALEEPLLDGERKLGFWRVRQRRWERGMDAPLSPKQQAALRATPIWGTGGGLL